MSHSRAIMAYTARSFKESTCPPLLIIMAYRLSLPAMCTIKCSRLKSFALRRTRPSGNRPMRTCPACL